MRDTETATTWTCTSQLTPLFDNVTAYKLQGRMQQVAIDTFDAAGVKTRTERTTFDYDDAGFRISSPHEVDADANGTFETRTLTEFLADSRNPTGYTQTIQERVTNADTGAEIKRTVYKARKRWQEPF